MHSLQRARLEDERPWKIEKEAIKELSLPLNLRDDYNNKFVLELSKVRSEMRRKAKSLHIVPN